MSRSIPVSCILFLFASGQPSSATTWEAVGPDTGIASGIVQSPSDPSVLYCLAEADTSERLLRSDDHGATWEDVGDIPADHGTYCLGISPSGSLFAGDVDWVWRSTDQGGSWEGISCEDLTFYAFAFDPADSQRVMATGRDDSGGTHLTFLTSNDDGINWTSQVLCTSTSVGHCVAVCPSDPDRICVGGSRSGPSMGIAYLSTDGGDTFTDISSSLWVDSDVRSVLLPTGQPGTILAATESGAYLSTDGGATWSCTVPMIMAYSILESPAQPGTILCSHPDGVLRSVDGGQSWEPWGEGLYGGSPFPLLFSEDTPGLVFVGSLEGLFMSTDDGQSWSHVDFGESYADVRTIEIGGGSQPSLYAVTHNAPDSEPGMLYRSDDWGDSWLPAVPLNSRVYRVAADPFDAMTAMLSGMLPGSEAQSLYLTTDGGGTWDYLDDFYHYGVRIEADPATPGRYWAFGRSLPGTDAGYCIVISRTQDYGSTWTRHLLSGVYNNVSLCSISIDPCHPDTVYCLCEVNGNEMLLAVTHNGGASWTEVYPTGMLDGPEDLVFTSIGGGRLLTDAQVDSTMTLSLSEDGGLGWTGTGSGFSICRDLDVHPQYPSYVTSASTSEGVAVSCDGGTGWYLDSEGLEDVYVMTVCCGADQYLFCGGSDDGIYRCDHPIVTSVEQPEGSSGNGALSVFPNPVMASGSVGFALSVAGTVTAELYDVSGRRISGLSRSFESGNHVIGIGEILGDVDPPVGLYFLRLRLADGEPVSASFVLTR